MPIRTPIKSSTETIQETKVAKAGSGFALFTLFVLLLIAAGGFAWAYRGYANTQKELNLLKNPNAKQEETKKETVELVNRLGKLVVLPQGEEPTVATVTDAAAMAKEQPFYKDSHDGDKLVVFVQARKAYLYDPIKNILVNVGPIFIDENAVATSTTSTAQNKPLTIEIRNGSTTTGKGAALANEFKQVTGYTILPASNAANKDYAGNVIVDLTNGAKAGQLSELASKIDGTITTTTPAGEKPSEADVLIIVGN